jgi:hypothetical protein
MRFLVEKVDDLTSKEGGSSANTDLELARRAFGDGDVTIIFWELDGKGFYNQQNTVRKYCLRQHLTKRKPSDGHRRQRCIL